jgi:hypothetical protein
MFRAPDDITKRPSGDDTHSLKIRELLLCRGARQHALPGI